MKLTINAKAFPDTDPGLLQEMLGVLPYWVGEYIVYGYMKGENIVDFMTERYGFGKLFQFKGEVTEEGTYKSTYEEDDDLPYIGKLLTPDGPAYFYQYAMIALPLPNGEYFITRMD